MRESERKRFNAEAGLVDKVLALDQEWLAKQGELERLRKEKNVLNKQVGMKKRAKEPCEDLIAQSKDLGKAIAELEVTVGEVLGTMQSSLKKIGNLVHESVPVSNDEENNEIVSKWGECRQEDDLQSHADCLWRIGGGL